MSARSRVLVVDDDPSIRTAIGSLIESAGHEVRAAADADQAIEEMAARPVDLVLLDLRLGDTSGLDLLPALRQRQPECAVVMISALGTIESAVEAMRLGADNFVTKPIEPARLLAIVDKGIEGARLRRRSERLERLAIHPPTELLHASPAMAAAIALLEAVAPRETTVLLRGETGTGKGLLARRLHELSPRAGGPFVELNCAGLQPELTESELFGHERGAFTGAHQRKVGLFEVADGGTFLLDEIGEMALAVQAKLLKVIESGRFRRVGGTIEVDSDARLVAATHRDLERAVEAGSFRRDLLFRLDVFAIEIPPLRERREEIEPLARHFLGRQRREGGEVDFTDAALTTLVDYDWPGNVRELGNVVERASILAPPGEPIGVAHLPPLGTATATDRTADGDLSAAERAAVERAMAASRGNLKAAAEALGVSRGTLYRKLRKYGLSR